MVIICWQNYETNNVISSSMNYYGFFFCLPTEYFSLIKNSFLDLPELFKKTFVFLQ